MSNSKFQTFDLDLKTKAKTMDVSRSGRIRKKSSKLADFESPDEIDAVSQTKKLNKTVSIGHTLKRVKDWCNKNKYLSVEDVD